MSRGAVRASRPDVQEVPRLVRNLGPLHFRVDAVRKPDDLFVRNGVRREILRDLLRDRDPAVDVGD